MACVLRFLPVELHTEPEGIMKTTKVLTITAAIALVLTLSGCRRLLLEPDYYPPTIPSGLYTETGDGFVELFWDENWEHDVAGYNVYAASRYEGPYDLIGSSNEAYFVDRDARNGVTYYYAVSAYDYEGNESGLSKDVAYDIPRPEGYGVLLQDSWVSADFSGYDFSAYDVVAYDAQSADMYYEYDNSEYYMVVRTDTDILDMGYTGSLLDVRTAPTSGWSTTHDVRLRVGHTYVVWTWDDHYAKFRVTSLSASRVTFDWAYQLQTGTRLLKRPAGERAPVAKTLLGHDRTKSAL
jgi:hypothetical protein